MNYVEYLLKFLAFLPGIVSTVQSLHGTKTVDEKTAIASNVLQTSTAIATSLLPTEQGRIASVAGAAAQSVLAVVVQAVHDAGASAPAVVAVA